MDKLVVVGQGYVGLPLALRAAEAGFQVIGLDTDEGRVKRILAGQPETQGPDDEDRLERALASGRYLATVDTALCAGFDVAVIDVPTPLTEGVPDLGAVRAAAATVATHLRRGATVILESTTYPGTTEELVAPILEEGSGLMAGVDFHLGYSPERLDPGNKQW